MDFAKNLLKKYGWKEGDGLGKNNDGINKPIKANLKFDTAGLGVDKATEFNNHWWERVYNDAAQNVQINKDNNGIVNMNLKNPEDTVEITTKSYSTKKLKKAKVMNGDGSRYDTFIQSGTLSKSGNHVESEHKVELNDIAVTSVKVLTDEELFAACGGRTAHKGARHGLTLNGKLSRIERQEEELLARMRANYNGLNKQNKRKEEHENENNITINRKKKKKHKDTENLEETICLEQDKNCNENQEDIIEEEPKKKKKKRDRCKDVPDEINVTEEVQIKKKSKKKKRSCEIADEVTNNNNEITIEENQNIRKKSKKNKT